MADPLDSLHNSVVNSKREAIAQSTKVEKPLPSNKLIFCNQCKGPTNHICKAGYSRQYLADVEKYLGGFWKMVGYRLWMCAGCEACTLEEYYTDEFMEDNVDNFGGERYIIDYFPTRTEFHVDGKQFLQLPEKLDNLYRETLYAFNYNLSVLCAAGLRTLIEGICEDKQVKGRNLEDKINGLAKILPQNIVVNLHSFRFIGNTALHTLTAPSQEDLHLAIEICEDLLNFLYELDYKANRLGASHQAKMKADKIKTDTV